MRIILSAIIFTVLLSFTNIQNANAGASFEPGDALITFNETDAGSIESTLVYFFDLRERETFIQFTYFDGFQTGTPSTAHVQIFNVGNLCNENDFFDTYTINDTHTYNMRDILTNDGNPSGVDLPDDAYGMVLISSVSGLSNELRPSLPIGNFRIVDSNGYEYRTNAQSALLQDVGGDGFSQSEFYSFNYNMKSGVSLSDVVGITYSFIEAENPLGFEATALPPQALFSPFDIDIYDVNEVPFSCRDIIFSCVDENNPLLEEVLSVAGTANVAAFEYGINNAVPHSKGGELLCPGNVNPEGIVVLRPEQYPDTPEFSDLIRGLRPAFAGYVGLNNGNGRGSMDSFWIYNSCVNNPECFVIN